MKLPKKLGGLVLAATLLGWMQAPEREGQSEALVAALRDATQDWLKTLDEEQRNHALFSLNDPERRAWSNLPHNMFRRQGVSFGEMNVRQKAAAHALLRTALSPLGYSQVTGIMHLDQILSESYGEANSVAVARYGHAYYWLGVFGDVDGQGPWGLQLDGHHLALNLTMTQGRVTISPTFFGANPVEVPDGPYAGWKQFDDLDQTARALIQSFDEGQGRAARIATTSPGDVLAGPAKADRIGKIKGFPVGQFNPLQRELLEDLVAAWYRNWPPSVAARGISDFHSDLEDGLAFAFLGEDFDQPYAWRLHGRRTWIELSNSPGVGSKRLGMNHIHAVGRELGNDYGDALLKRSR